MKIYTKTGDKGTTSLADGIRLEKDDIRIDTYGTIDELNSIIALCRCDLATLPDAEKRKQIDSWLFTIQNELFNLGSDLATAKPHANKKSVIGASEEKVKALEKMIDYCQSNTPELRQFILPGGSYLNAHLHLARTVCRRAERLAVSLAKKGEINSQTLPFLNRLSDFFFTLARYVQIISKIEEISWDKEVILS